MKNLLLIVLAVALFSACGGNSNTMPVVQATPPADTTHQTSNDSTDPQIDPTAKTDSNTVDSTSFKK